MLDNLIKVVRYIIDPKPILHYMHLHFGKNPKKFPILHHEFPSYRNACVYRAVQSYLSSPVRRHTALGVAGATYSYHIGMRDFLNTDDGEKYTEGAIEYVDVPSDSNATTTCARSVLYLIREGNKRLACFLYQEDQDEDYSLEVLAEDRKHATEFIEEIKRLADIHSIYRGKVIRVKQDTAKNRHIGVHFHRVPLVAKAELILPEKTMKEIEQHGVGFSNFRNELLSYGCHLKRGLLLYGPPGTGKSLTVMYLVGRMPGRTCVLVNGRNSVDHFEDACDLARTLAPSTVIIDDADLIAQERSNQHSNPVLFELLNQMDGIGDDADVLFVLTTNRPEVLEPALAARPGRIDRAILIPLPDGDCRAKLFALYSKDLPFAVNDIERFIDRTDGVSAAFIRELLRNATLLALQENLSGEIRDSHIEAALDSLLCASPFTSRLLGNMFRDEVAEPVLCSGD